ncbi:hypothetical protein AM231_18075 [Paenibacillus solani]|uniref:Uncharacterized protein n=1 Tax=Paenibacillus solani TaxID=1705565 RepID=A0A0M1NJF1_9BACL|nr:hypothetical protein AM231_18075 [Paenibacillus solani]
MQKTGLTYDKTNDTYRCKEGKTLRFTHINFHTDNKLTQRCMLQKARIVSNVRYVPVVSEKQEIERPFNARYFKKRGNEMLPVHVPTNIALFRKQDAFGARAVSER